VAGFPGPGDRMSRYRIVSRIGTGGMGVVFEAVDEALGRPVALKVMSPIISSDASFQQRFRREAELLARLDSPHVVNVYDVGEHQDLLFMATQYVGGGDLHSLLEQQGPPGTPVAVGIVLDVLRGLADAHDAGVVHRDVKPSNVLLRTTPHGMTALLCDFGIATAAGFGITRHGTVMGSYLTMAPERYHGSPGDARSDLYSAGCLLYAAITGSAPYSGSEAQLAFGHVSGPLPVLVGDDPTTRRLNAVLARLLAKEPEHRFPDAHAAADALAAVPLAPPPDPAPPTLLPTSPPPTQPPTRPPTQPPTRPPAPVASPFGAPTQAPPRAQPPTQPPTQPSTRPPGPPGPPPGGSPWGAPGYPPPPGAVPHQTSAPRRRRTRALVAGAVALVLVAGAGAGVWAYTAGHLGFGPLTEREQEQADVLAASFAEVDDAWDDADVACGAEDLVRERGVGGYESWSQDTATAMYDAVLACTDDWSGAMAALWGVDDGACFDDAGREDVASVLAPALTGADPADDPDGRSRDLVECARPSLDTVAASATDREARVEEVTPRSGHGLLEPTGYRVEVGDLSDETGILDRLAIDLPDNDGTYELVVSPLFTLAPDGEGDDEDVVGSPVTVEVEPWERPGAPVLDGDPVPGYRSVELRFEAGPSDQPAVVQQQVDGRWVELTGGSVSVDTGRGSAKGCARVRTLATHADTGVEQSGPEVSRCGRAAPPTIRAERVPGRCPAGRNPLRGCTQWTVAFEGFAANEEVVYALHLPNGQVDTCSNDLPCRATYTVGADGRGTQAGWLLYGPNRFTFRSGRVQSPAFTVP
jgi:serine/threonine protein kinase